MNNCLVITAAGISCLSSTVASPTADIAGSHLPLFHATLIFYLLKNADRKCSMVIGPIYNVSMTIATFRDTNAAQILSFPPRNPPHSQP